MGEPRASEQTCIVGAAKATDEQTCRDPVQPINYMQEGLTEPYSKYLGLNVITVAWWLAFDYCSDDNGQQFRLGFLANTA